MKLAREATGRPMILTFYGQYHGETTYLTASASTDLSEVTTANAQYVAGLVFAPYPNTFRAPFHRGPGPFDDRCTWTTWRTGSWCTRWSRSRSRAC